MQLPIEYNLTQPLQKLNRQLSNDHLLTTNFTQTLEKLIRQALNDN